MIAGLQDWIKAKISQYPQLESEIMGFYELALLDIEEGNSIFEATDKCRNSIEELINK